MESETAVPLFLRHPFQSVKAGRPCWVGARTADSTLLKTLRQAYNCDDVSLEGEGPALGSKGVLLPFEVTAEHKGNPLPAEKWRQRPELLKGPAVLWSRRLKIPFKRDRGDVYDLAGNSGAPPIELDRTAAKEPIIARKEGLEVALRFPRQSKEVTGHASARLLLRLAVFVDGVKRGVPEGMPVHFTSGFILRTHKGWGRKYRKRNDGKWDVKFGDVAEGKWLTFDPKLQQGCTPDELPYAFGERLQFSYDGTAYEIVSAVKRVPLESGLEECTPVV